MSTANVNTIPLMACESSMLHAYGYDAATQTLAVQFKNGTKVAQYRGITPDDFAALEAADSIGKHFGRHIRGREFTYADPPPTDSEGGEPD
jgi:hypothetical protein